MNDRMRVAARCRQMRERSGYTLFQLEGLTGLSLSTLRAAEQAGRVSPRTAERLAAVFKCKVAELVTVSPQTGAAA